MYVCVYYFFSPEHDMLVYIKQESNWLSHSYFCVSTFFIFKKCFHRWCSSPLVPEVISVSCLCACARMCMCVAYHTAWNDICTSARVGGDVRELAHYSVAPLPSLQTVHCLGYWTKGSWSSNLHLFHPQASLPQTMSDPIRQAISLQSRMKTLIFSLKNKQWKH